MLTDRQRLRLTHIVENAARIKDHVANLDYITFQSDPKTIDAVERCLARITEAAIRIGEATMAAVAPAVPRMSIAASATPCATTTIRSTSAQSG